MSNESVMPSNHLILCRPLLLLPSIFPSIMVFSNESALCIRWPKNWSFSFSISPLNECSGLISFRIDWLDPLEVQGTQESSPTPQFESIKSWALSLLYGLSLTSINDNWKNRSYADFVDKVISLLFNTLYRLVMEKEMATHSSILAWRIPGMEERGGLPSMGLYSRTRPKWLSSSSSRFVIAFLPRSKCFFNFLAEVTVCSNFGAQENKICPCFHFSPNYLPWSDGTRCHDLSFLNVSNTWEHVKNADSWVPPRTTESETLGLGPGNQCLNKPSRPFWCVRNTCLYIEVEACLYVPFQLVNEESWLFKLEREKQSPWNPGQSIRASKRYFWNWPANTHHFILALRSEKQT